MYWIRLTLACALLGCGGSSANGPAAIAPPPPEQTAEQTRADREPPTPAPATPAGAEPTADAARRAEDRTAGAEPEPPRGPAVRLRRDHDRAQRYRRTTSVFMSDNGTGRPVRVTVSGTVRIVPRDGGFHAEMALEETSVSSEGRQARRLPASVSGLSRVTLRWADDVRNQRLEPIAVQGTTEENQAFVEQVIQGMELLRFSYPAEPLAPGGVLEEPTLQWDTRPVGWVVAHVDRRARLLEAADDTAIFAVDADARIEPFDAMGIPLEAHVRMRGRSMVRLSDGLPSRTELDGEAIMRPAGTDPGAGGARVVLKIEDELTPLP